MAPLPANNTERWYLDYVTGNHATAEEHTMQIRTPTLTSPTAVCDKFFAILNGVTAANLWVGWRPIRLRWAPAGLNFSTPQPISGALATFQGSGVLTGYQETQEALEVTFQGRSPLTGRRVDLSLYGFRSTAVLSAYRFTTAVGWVNSAVAALNAGSPECRTIDGSNAVWYPYVNLNYNSYWEGELR